MTEAPGKCGLSLLLFVTALLPTGSAFAQATANALAVAEDAFGSAEGSESIGIYDETTVRGFSLEAAGNYRINGRYFVKNSGVSSFFVEKTIVRIGHNALWLDYPGPSGVVDYRLRDPAAGESSLVTLGLDSYEQPFAEVHFKHRSVDESLAASVGASKRLRTADEQGGEGRDVLFAGTMRKTIGAARLQAFAGEYRYHRTGRFRLGLSSDAEELPAEIERGRYLGQSWATEEGARRIAGVLGDVELANDWSSSALVVFAQEAPDRRITQLFSDIGPDELASNRVIVSPEQRSHSYSGELRLGRIFQAAAFTHAAALNARFRASRSRFGGERTLEGEPVRLGERPAPLAAPDFEDSRALLSDRIDQQGFGITYQLSLPNRFRVGGGLLYSDYSKQFTDEFGVDIRSDAAPWLYNASAALMLREGLELYGSYSRGLEEAGIAPTTAANANEVLEAAIATQKELGLRAVLRPGVTIMLAGFETRKPQVGIDARSGEFDFLGDVRHRGIESSLSGELSPAVSVVAGAAYTDAQVSGQGVSLGLVSERPVNVPKWRAVINLNYQASPQLSVDAGIEHTGERIARSRLSPSGRQLMLPGATFVDAGMRYRFKISRTPFVLRAQVLNLLNRFAWRSAPGETLDYAPQRSLRLLVTAEI